MASRQRTLKVSLPDDATFENYYAGNNLAAVTALDALVKRAPLSERFIYIWGPSGVGKTHLLYACCHVLNSADQSCCYLSLADHQQLDPEMLQGLEQLPLVCLDDIYCVFGLPEWEEALLHFYNRAREQATCLVVAGEAPPAQCQQCQLQDLRSRLGWGPVFQLQPLDDEQKILALQMRGIHRGMRIPEEVSHYLLNHYQRDTKALFKVLDWLDFATLAEKRRLTVPFVRKVLETGSKNDDINE